VLIEAILMLLYKPNPTWSRCTCIPKWSFSQSRYLKVRARTGTQTWPWPWPDDLDVWTCPRYSEDLTAYQ